MCSSDLVQVEDATQATAHYGVYGPAAAEIVSSIALTPRAAVLPSLDAGVSGFEVIALRSQGPELARTFAESGAVAVAASTLDVVRIEAGIPKFLVDMTTDTIPLEATIEDRAISMTKGCYPGQEVIIRVLHRGGGRVAKKLVGFRFDDGMRAPSGGEKVRSGDREIGVVTSAAWSPRLAGAIALGYVHRDFVTPGTQVVVGDANAKISALPFYPSASADLAP